jgi:hypothetical protein
MSLQQLPHPLGHGGVGYDRAVPRALKELQGLRLAVVAGAAGNTKMNIAAIREEDTILSAIVSTDAGGALADDTANVTIVSTKASGTLTVDALVADNACVVNGVTYTFKATPTQRNHIQYTVGNSDTADALLLANTINAYESHYDGAKALVPAVVATANNAVVTVTAIADGTAGNSIVLTGTALRLAASGAGTLAGGTATGGIKSTTTLSNKSLIVMWFDKQ